MAKYEKQGRGSYSQILADLHKTITGNSISSKLENQSSFTVGDVRIAFRVYERYSFIGGNRLSLSFTLVGSRSNNEVRLSVITAGGSQAIFFKLNRFGENSFINTIKPVVDKLIK